MSKPVEIAKNVFLIKTKDANAYLIAEEEAVLINCGSLKEFDTTIELLSDIVSLEKIKYIILPDNNLKTLSGLYLINKVFRENKTIVTHSKIIEDLKSCDLKFDYYAIDKNSFALKFKKRNLEFILTPYVKGEVSFCVYDKRVGIIFTNSLFNTQTQYEHVYVDNMQDYILKMEESHRYIFPKREILNFYLSNMEKKHAYIIAPQCGAVLKKEEFETIKEYLKEIECGGYLHFGDDGDLYVLSKSDEMLRNFFKDTVSLSEFNLVLRNLFENVKKEIPSIKEIEICGISPLSARKYCFSFSDDHKIVEIDKTSAESSYKQKLKHADKEIGEVSIIVKKSVKRKEKRLLEVLLNKIASPLAVSLEKALMLRELEEYPYENPIIDKLTDLYNKQYLLEFLTQKLKEVNRYKFPLSLAMIDIDYFKKINEEYGKLIGDCVLKEIAVNLKENFRGSDLVARLGNDKFVVVMPFTTCENACKRMKEFKELISKKKFCDNKRIKLTLSIGVCSYQNEETDKFMLKVDRYVYFAKRRGRNKVVCENNQKD